MIDCEAPVFDWEARVCDWEVPVFSWEAPVFGWSHFQPEERAPVRGSKLDEFLVV